MQKARNKAIKETEKMLNYYKESRWHVQSSSLEQCACGHSGRIKMPNDSAVLGGVTAGTKQTSFCGNALSMAHIEAWL